jgi:hypothetical protein
MWISHHWWVLWVLVLLPAITAPFWWRFVARGDEVGRLVSPVLAPNQKVSSICEGREIEVFAHRGLLRPSVLSDTEDV